MATKNLTAADTILHLSVENVYSTYQKISGFAEDSMIEFQSLQTGVAIMGVDGNLSGGYTPAPTTMTITLQADSDSTSFFNQWHAAQVANKTSYVASGLISHPSLQEEKALVKGFLTGFQPVSAKKTLQPFSVTITWESAGVSQI